MNFSADTSTDSRFDQHEATKTLLKIYEKHNISLSCLEDIAVLINNISKSKSSIEVPDTKYKLMKCGLTNSHLTYFIKCALCNIYTSGNYITDIHCSKCKKHLYKTETNYFVYINLKKQIEISILRHWNTIIQFREKCLCDIQNDNEFIDVHSGDILKNILIKNSNEYILSFCLNIDGANKFKSNKFSVWPIQLIQNHLPPNIRYLNENLIVCGLFYNKEKPIGMQYLEPLAEIFEELQTTGIDITYNDTTLNFKAFITQSSVDLPAKSILQNITQYNGYYGCTFCKMKGVAVKNLNNNRYTVRFLHSSADNLNRSHKETLTVMDKIQNNGQIKTYGIKGLSCMVAFQEFNMIDSFSIDYMHCILLGTMSKLLELWLDTKNFQKPYYINNRRRNELNKRLLDIKPTNNITRKARRLNLRSDFTAYEFKMLLLYYLQVCLIGLLPSKYLKHFELLSSSIYALLNSKVALNELNLIEKKLVKFVIDFEKLYGQQHVTMNIHLLTHIPNSIKQLGPLWTQSVFSFERMNGVLLKYVSGTKDVIHQMATKYCLSRLNNWEKGKRSENITTVRFLGKPDIVVMTSEEIKILYENDIHLKNNTILHKYKRMQINNVVFTSKAYKPISTIDYFVNIKDRFGKVKYYFEINGVKYGMISQYGIIEKIDHIYKVSNLEISFISNVNLISDKLLYMNVKEMEYVVLPPNEFELGYSNYL